MEERIAISIVIETKYLIGLLDQLAPRLIPEPTHWFKEYTVIVICPTLQLKGNRHTGVKSLIRRSLGLKPGSGSLNHSSIVKYAGKLLDDIVSFLKHLLIPRPIYNMHVVL